MGNHCGSGQACGTCHCTPCTCKEGQSCSHKNDYWKQKLEKKIEFNKMMLSAMEEKDSEKRHARIRELLEEKIEYYKSCLKKCD